MGKFETVTPRALWLQLKQERFSFWMICAYLVLEYVRPQSIVPALDVLPWDKIMIGLTSLGLLADPERRWVRHPVNVWMTLFLVVILLSSTFAEYPAVSWLHWADFVDWYIIYFLIINTVTTSRRFTIFLGIYLLANLKLSFFGARTWAARGFGFTGWGIQGPPGFFTNSADLSIEMLMFMPIAFELILYVRPYVKRTTFWILMLFPLTGAMTVLGASSRGAQVGLAAQVAHSGYQRKMKLKAILAVALIVWAGYSLLPAAERARFTRAGDDRTSIQRLDYWKAGVKMIEKHPIFGVGYFNFPSYFAAHYPHELWDGYAQLPHNIFIQVGTDTGLLGLGIFLMLIYGNLKAAKDIQRLCENHEQAPRFASSVARGLATAVWGFVIAGQFDTVTYYPFFWINLALTISLANIVTRSVEQKAAQAQAAPFGRSVRGRQSRASPAQRHQAAPR